MVSALVPVGAATAERADVTVDEFDGELAGQWEAAYPEMVLRARKCRMLGSAALDMAYIACGRLDAYIEEGISLWDIAAGWLLVESAGGHVEMRPRADMPDKFSIIASNGLLDPSA